MPSTTTPRVDVGALAAGIRLEVSNRVANMLSVGFESSSGNGHPLSQLQQIDLTSAALECFDGFERGLASTILEELRQAGVEGYGLPSFLEDLKDLGGDA